MTTTITARAASQIINPGESLPPHVQWMPPGKQTVQPMGFDAPFEMNVTSALARLADAQLQQLRSAAAAGKDVEPYFDFNHKDEGRAFKPTRFFWGGDDPKNGGIRAEGTWTGAGAKAVLDGELCCVSATWTLNKQTKEFIGINHNVGGLVPRSAFHSIQAFAKATDSIGDVIADQVLPDMLKAKLEKKYQVDLTPKDGEKNHPFEILVNRIGEKVKVPASALYSVLQGTEPELWDFHLKQFRQTNHNDTTAFQAQACAYGMQLGITDELEAQTAFAHTKAGNIAYLKTIGRDVPAETQLLAQEARAQAAAEFSAHPFLAKAKAFGESSKITDEVDAQSAFAHTQEGRALYDDYCSSLSKVSRTLAVQTRAATSNPGEHAFIAQARAYGVTNKIVDELEAQVAFAGTTAGRKLYTEFCESL